MPHSNHLPGQPWRLLQRGAAATALALLAACGQDRLLEPTIDPAQSERPVSLARQTSGPTAVKLGADAPAARVSGGDKAVASRTSSDALPPGTGVGATLAMGAGEGGSASPLYILWQNTSTGTRGFWPMNGTTYTGGWENLADVPTQWEIVGVGDFTQDNIADVVWQNTSTGMRGVWPMSGANGTTYAGGWIELGEVPTNWDITAVGDINNDGHADLVWHNLSNGMRGIYLMNGATLQQWVELGQVPSDWEIVGMGDFNGDHRKDLVWQNVSTGARGAWPMDGGTYVGGWLSFGEVPAPWSISAVADFSGDGQADLVWTNESSGRRGIWLMSNTDNVGWAELGEVPPGTWKIAGVIRGPMTHAPTCTGPELPFNVTIGGDIEATDCAWVSPYSGSTFTGDVYQLTLATQTAITFTVEGNGTDPVGIWVREGDQLRTGSIFTAPTYENPGRVRVVLPAGTYSVHMTGANGQTTGSYYLQATAGIESGVCYNTHIRAGVTIAGETATTECAITLDGVTSYEDRYVLFLNAGERINVTMNSGTMPPMIGIRMLAAPPGELLASAVRGETPGTVQVAWTAQESGYHQVIVKSGDATRVGSYALDVQYEADACELTDWSMGTWFQQAWTTSDCLAGTRRADYFNFTHATNSGIVFQLNAATGKNIGVFSADGSVSYGSVNQSTADSLRVQYLLPAGTYRFRAAGAANDTLPVADYRFNAWRDDNNVYAMFTFVAPGASAAQFLGEGDAFYQESYEDYYYLWTPAGTTRMITATSGAFAPRIVARHNGDTPGTWRAESNGDGTTTTLSYTPTVDTYVQFVVRHPFGGTGGSYHVSFPTQ